ncbi:hypothetical protein SLEP1_g4611 [Rubroshorea leprosula]|uniref:Reverse transcriptase zinc-binding domain-containing protein n=1 Tax=Rubroshorea leprosula TaxID=152421 RepID=A0AAV5HTK9_9ROSI|nr:hypothetical protein SLEP1_g4611 [Rubroshorea leprosula]
MNVGWLSEGFRIKVGEGKRVSFWWDEWCGEGFLGNKFPRLYLLSTSKKKECYQMGNTQSGTWKWNLSWRRILFQWEEEDAKELCKMIEEVKIYPRCPDEWEWRHSKDGLYSTSIAYTILTKDERGPVETKFFKRVWNPVLPSKIAAFNWKVMMDRIPTKLNLFKR